MRRMSLYPNWSSSASGPAVTVHSCYLPGV